MWPSPQVSKAYLEIAYAQALESPDPSTQNGAVLVAPEYGVIGYGYNRFARGLAVTPERLADRNEKYPRTVHAEIAAIAHAITCFHSANDLSASTLFACWFACTECSKMIIEMGIRHVVGHAQHPGVTTPGSWSESVARGLDMLKEAGVEYSYYDGELGCAPVKFNGTLWRP